MEVGLGLPLQWTAEFDRVAEVRLDAGTFKLTLQFTEEYPNKAPVVKFKSHMFHPNSKSTTTLWCNPGDACQRPDCVTVC